MIIVIPVFGFGRSGGERVLSKLASELIERGCVVYFLTLNNSDEIYYETKAKIVKCIASKSNNRAIRFIKNNISLYKGIRKLKPDVVIANFHLTAFIVSMLPKEIIKYYYIQAYEVNFYSSVVRKSIAYISYLLPLKKIVNSPGLLPLNISKGVVDIIPPGIDDGVFFSREINSGVNNIGVIGRIEKHKGTSRIIDSILNWEGKSVITLNIALYLDEVDRKRLNSSGVKYTFTEISNDHELANFYRMNDLVIATGLVEDGAFHYPCAEAISCGCAVISNYAPLAYTDSKLKILTFTEKTICEKLDLFISMSDEEVKSEIIDNKNFIQLLNWESIGEKLYNLLKIEE